MKLVLIDLVLLLALALGVHAAEKRIQLPSDHEFGKLKPGPGADLTKSKCGLCHSTDYIVTQPRGDLARWQGEVTKMIKVFGAPVNNEEAKTISEYLATAYGPSEAGNPAAAKRGSPKK